MSKHRYTKITSLFFICFICLTMVSCNKDDDGSDITTPAPITVTTIGGRIMMTSHQPAAFVKVNCNNIATTTDSRGFYLFKNISVPAGRCVISLDNGFLKSVKPKSGGITYCDMVIPTNINEHTFNGISGGSITDISGVTINFQAASIQKANGNPYNGVVKVAIFYLDPSKPENSGINPIHDNQVIIDNNIKYAYSLGSVYVELTGSAGEKLNLIPQKPAVLSVPIATTRLTANPQIIQLVSADAVAGNWKHEGVATKAGNKYVATVTHFSWWNTVAPLGTALITGQVKDVAGHPIENATVTDYYNYQSCRTNQNGVYEFYVPDGWYYEIECDSYLNMGESAGPFLTPVLNANQIYTLADIIFQNATIINGNTTNCNNNPLVAFVTIVDSTEYYNYSIAGNDFSLFAGADKNVTLLSTQFNQYNQTDAVVGAAGSIFSTGTMQVCTTAPAGGNMSLTFTSPITGTQTGTLNMNEASVYTDSTNTWSFISLTSIDSLYLFGITNYFIELWLPVETSYVNSIMPWSQVFNTNFMDIPLVMYGEAYNNAYHSFEAIGNEIPSNPGSTHITFLGPVGTTITGSFEGPVEIYDYNTYDILLSGNLSGTFSVVRGM